MAIAVEKRTSRDAQSKAQRREEILDAAAMSFMKNGFSGSSVTSISNLMGQTKGTVYHHFDSKSDLFLEVHRRAMEMTLSALDLPDANLPPGLRLGEMAKAHVLLIMRKLPYLRVAAMGLEKLQSPNSGVLKKHEDVFEEIISSRDGVESRYVNVIRDGIDQGEFVPIDPSLAAKPVLGALNWTSRWFRPRPGQKDSELHEMANQMARFVVGGVKWDGSHDQSAK